jgi:hypothetical protein
VENTDPPTSIILVCVLLQTAQKAWPAEIGGALAVPPQVDAARPFSPSSNNELGAKGVEEIVNALASNRELTDLNLRCQRRKAQCI